MAGRGLLFRPIALLKRGWHEIPEVVGSGAFGVLGIAFGIIGVYRYYKNDGEKRLFKNRPTVFRPDDPRTRFVRQE